MDEIKRIEMGEVAFRHTWDGLDMSHRMSKVFFPTNFIVSCDDALERAGTTLLSTGPAAEGGPPFPMNQSHFEATTSTLRGRVGACDSGLATVASAP